MKNIVHGEMPFIKKKFYYATGDFLINRHATLRFDYDVLQHHGM